MAKKRNLLLTTLLAAVCLTALLVASFVVGGGLVPAQAADLGFEYKKQSAVTLDSNVDAQILLVANYSGSPYAITTNGTSLTLTKVTVENDKITSEVKNEMLWTLSKSGSYLRFCNVANSKYLSVSRSDAALSDTAVNFYGSNYLQDYNSENYIYISSSTSLNAAGENYMMTWTAYKKSAILANPTAITFNGGSVTHVDGTTLNASGSMPAQEVEKDSSFTLPDCKFKLSNYAFDGWNVQVGDGEVEKKQAGDTVSVTAPTTITATWAANYWTVTYTTEGTLLADSGLENTTLLIEKEKSANLGSKLSDRWSGATDPSGYIFDGWAMADTDEKITNYTWYKPTSDITVKPVFVKGISIVYDWNGGVAPTNSYTAFKNETKRPTDSYTLYTHYSSYDAAKMPTKVGGYVFAGWTCNNGKQYLADLTNTSGQSNSYKLNEEFVKEDNNWKRLCLPPFGSLTALR